MRQAVLIVLQTLDNQANEISSFRSEERFKTTRITNEISYIRNTLNIEVITDMVRKPNARPYGKYHLKRSPKNLKRVKEILATHSTKKPLKKLVN